MREWTIPLPYISDRKFANIVAKIAMDIMILALACIMLWQNWVVSSFTMVPWRCEYSMLLFAWSVQPSRYQRKNKYILTSFLRPIACMMWLLIAVGLVVCMKESMEVYDGFGHKLDYGMLDLLKMPYKFGPRINSRNASQGPVVSSTNETKPETGLSTLIGVTTNESPITQVHPAASESSAPSKSSTNRSDTIAFYEGAYIRVCITMPSNFGFRSWRCYEAVIEALAVGIYLYATFVLTSTLFLNADRAIVYSTVMTVCLSAVRILTTLF